jgi:hypothetical protein
MEIELEVGGTLVFQKAKAGDEKAEGAILHHGDFPLLLLVAPCTPSRERAS